MKVLYVDDEVDLLEIARDFFLDEQIHLDTSSEFHEALKLAKENSYDVIISDANMPTGTGFDLFRILRNDYGYKGKLIIATGDMQNKGLQELHGYDLAVYKPIDFFDLIETIKKLVG